MLSKFDKLNIKVNPVGNRKTIQMCRSLLTYVDLRIPSFLGLELFCFVLFCFVFLQLLTVPEWGLLL